MINTATNLLMMAFGPLLLSQLLIFACSGITNSDSQDDSAAQARVGQEFGMKAGQQVRLEGEDLQVKFVAVTEDSRCPADVNCIWAGNAAVKLEIVQGKCSTTLTLNSHERSQSAEEGKLGRYRLKLMKLNPYPRTDRKIGPGDYSATLLVTKE